MQGTGLSNRTWKSKYGRGRGLGRAVLAICKSPKHPQQLLVSGFPYLGFLEH